MDVKKRRARQKEKVKWEQMKGIYKRRFRGHVAEEDKSSVEKKIMENKEISYHFKECNS